MTKKKSKNVYTKLLKAIIISSSGGGFGRIIRISEKCVRRVKSMLYLDYLYILKFLRYINSFNECLYIFLKLL